MRRQPPTPEDHIRALRTRMLLLQQALIPMAREKRHFMLETYELESAALEWVLRHWDASRAANKEGH